MVPKKFGPLPGLFPEKSPHPNLPLGRLCRSRTCTLTCRCSGKRFVRQNRRTCGVKFRHPHHDCGRDDQSSGACSGVWRTSSPNRGGHSRRAGLGRPLDASSILCLNLNSVRIRSAFETGATLVQPAAVVAPGLPYGALDREHLTASLLALARRVGVDNVTMRALATEAHTSASSVYYHVKNKAEMLDLLIEAVVSSITVPTAGSWEEKLVALYHNAWRVLVDVPGIAALLQQRPHTAAAADMDRLTRKILHQSGLPAEEIQSAHALLYIQLLGAVALEHARANPSMGPALTAPSMEPIFTYGLQVILAGLAYRANGRRKKTTLKARRRSDVALTRKEPGDY